MARSLKVLDGARADYQPLKSYIVSDLGKAAWSSYEFSDDDVVIHLFIGTRQDFEAHLLSRLLG